MKNSVQPAPHVVLLLLQARLACRARIRARVCPLPPSPFMSAASRSAAACTATDTLEKEQLHGLLLGAMHKVREGECMGSSIFSSVHECHPGALQRGCEHVRARVPEECEGAAVGHVNHKDNVDEVLSRQRQARWRCEPAAPVHLASAVPVRHRCRAAESVLAPLAASSSWPLDNAAGHFFTPVGGPATPSSCGRARTRAPSPGDAVPSTLPPTNIWP